MIHHRDQKYQYNYFLCHPESIFTHAIYETKKARSLCICRMTKRFLDEENGEVTDKEMNCLKPKVSSIVMEKKHQTICQTLEYSKCLIL